MGEEVTDEVHFADFGRRAILNLRQTLASKILELQKDSLFAKYKDKIGNIIAADVYQVWKKEILLLDDEGNELLLPKTEQIPTDFYRKGETVRAIVQRVDNYNNNPKIILDVYKRQELSLSGQPLRSRSVLWLPMAAEQPLEHGGCDRCRMGASGL